jgi:hypothetical protein
VRVVLSCIASWMKLIVSAAIACSSTPLASCAIGIITDRATSDIDLFWRPRMEKT